MDYIRLSGLKDGSVLESTSSQAEKPSDRKPGYLRGAERLIVPGETNILLSHNPDVFPVAARQGFDLRKARPAKLLDDHREFRRIVPERCRRAADGCELDVHGILTGANSENGERGGGMNSLWPIPIPLPIIPLPLRLLVVRFPLSKFGFIALPKCLCLLL